MPVPMSPEEIYFTMSQLEDRNAATHAAHYDRVIDRMCAYVRANIDDFMECYEEVEDDEALYDIHLKHNAE